MFFEFRVTARSKAWTLGSWFRIPLKAWMSVCCSFVLCPGSGLVTGWSLVQGVLLSVWKRLRNWRKGKGPTKGCRAIDEWMKKLFFGLYFYIRFLYLAFYHQKSGGMQWCIINLKTFLDLVCVCILMDRGIQYYVWMIYWHFARD
jgi:hypothetical protein